jgi:hypothetical protein
MNGAMTKRFNTYLVLLSLLLLQRVDAQSAQPEPRQGASAEQGQPVEDPLGAAEYLDSGLASAFLAIQEDLLLEVLDVIDASGTSLASPLPAALLAAERALDA